MGFHNIPPYFRNPGLPLWLLAVVGTICPVSFSDNTTPELRGEVGENVTFCCPVDKQRKIKFFYFQSGDTFINGYYESRDIAMPTWENTRVDRDNTCVYMYKLNISHSREYKCIIQYNDSSAPIHVPIQLKVTATYSKPTVTKSCDDKSHGSDCLVTCASYGGYPGHKMEWTINYSSQMWIVVNSSDEPNRITMLFNSSSTVLFNCSNGTMESLRCSVGNISSNTFSVCEPKAVPVSDSSIIIAAVCVIFGIVVAMAMGLSLYLKRRRTEERRAQDNNGETVVLKEKNGGEQTP